MLQSQAAAAEIRRDGGEALAVRTDVTDYGQVEAVARRAADAYGRIDTWVSNAAVSAYATFKEQPLEDFRQILEVKLHGAGALRERRRCRTSNAPPGALVYVGSTLSDRGGPVQGAYCASKHALKGWLDSLRVEFLKEGSTVRVTLVKPSSINTPLFNKATTQMGVMPRPVSPIYEPELAAAAMLRAAESNERDIVVGGAGKALSVAERISPKLVDLQQRFQGFEGQKTNWPKDGRPRLKGERLLLLSAVLTHAATAWQRAAVAGWYGEAARALELATGTAVWHHPGVPLVPLRWVLVRDPVGRFDPQALLSTDPTLSAADVVRCFVRRWQVEATLQETHRHFGVETQRQWNDAAIARTTPVLLARFSVVTLLAARLVHHGRLPVRTAAWYAKPMPTFSDARAAARSHWWRWQRFRTSPSEADMVKLPRRVVRRLSEAACYAA